MSVIGKNDNKWALAPHSWESDGRRRGSAARVGEDGIIGGRKGSMPNKGGAGAAGGARGEECAMTHCSNCGQPLTTDAGTAANGRCPRCGAFLGDDSASSRSEGPALPVPQPISADFAVQNAAPRASASISALPAGGASGNCVSNAPAQSVEEVSNAPSGAPAPAPIPMAVPVAPSPEGAPSGDALPLNEAAPVAPPSPGLPKGLAVGALVLGIVALLVCWIPFVNVVSVVLGLVALVLGAVAIGRVRKGVGAGRGLGLAGVITGAAAVVLAVMVLLASIFVVESLRSGEMDINEVFPWIQQEGIEKEKEKDDEAAQHGKAASDAPWADLRFEFGGQSFQLGTTTLEDFEELSGWTLDLAAQGYPNGYIVQPSEEITDISLSNAGNQVDGVRISVVNTDHDQRDIKRCVLSEIAVVDRTGDLSCTFDGGIGLGSTIDEVIGAYGQPSYSFISDSGGHSYIDYEIDGDDREVMFSASEGETIDALEASLD